MEIVFLTIHELFWALVKTVNEIILKHHLNSILGGFSLKDQHVRFLHLEGDRGEFTWPSRKDTKNSQPPVSPLAAH